MAEDFLSQDEVDALLKGATTETEEAPQEEEKGGTRPDNDLRGTYASVCSILCAAQWIFRWSP